MAHTLNAPTLFGKVRSLDYVTDPVSAVIKLLDQI